MARFKHGCSKERLYRIWNGMRSRCYNKNVPRYSRYGARGITVCEEWKDDYIAFKEWALANGYRDDLTLDRKNNDGPYCPENCRWATVNEQGVNKSNNRFVELNGEKHTVSEWAKILNVSEGVIRGRLSRKNLWTETEALTAPVARRSETLERK